MKVTELRSGQLGCEVSKSLIFKAARQIAPIQKVRQVRDDKFLGTIIKLEPAGRLNLKNPDNIIRTSSNEHNFVYVGLPRMKGKCVNCLKKNRTGLRRINTLCNTCPGSNWMCEPCFEELHSCVK
ncbi:GD19980 [Drosophila simulans]|uniref:GD19980 n=2 Tax=melanogaster subgroup TaxID=32351 RepID=B4R102_DROSI|nr:GD19980 [Drosophila simulans]